MAYKLRVLELYSGIGGMHCALKETGICFEVVAAMDVNDVANAVYKHNFKDTKILQRSIEALTAEDCDRMQIDVLLMSPPCQPYTRLGKQQGAGDKRAVSFMHVMEILPRLQTKPKYILMENVCGFEKSECRSTLNRMLQDSNYHIQEFLLSPVQFGIPNSRLRYYLLAKLKPLSFAIQFEQQQICTTLPPEALRGLGLKIEASGASMLPTLSNSSHVSSVDDNDQVSEPPMYKQYEASCKELSHYLETLNSEASAAYRIPAHILRRYQLMDIVVPTDRHSCCFTKGYGHHIEGAGSFLAVSAEVRDNLGCAIRDQEQIPKSDNAQELSSQLTAALNHLQLRYFTPREIANLMCFPSSFGFPDNTTTKQCYRLLGNSLNVHVVAILLKLMLVDNSTLNA